MINLFKWYNMIVKNIIYMFLNKYITLVYKRLKQLPLSEPLTVKVIVQFYSHLHSALSTLAT